MNMRCGLCLICLWTLAAAPAGADDAIDAKLDAILQKLESLTERVTRIEKQLQTLTDSLSAKGQPAVPAAPSGKLHKTFIPLKRPVNPAGVIQMQGESPGSLIEGLHERERQLRQRVFPPERFTPSDRIP